MNNQSIIEEAIFYLENDFTVADFNRYRGCK